MATRGTIRQRKAVDRVLGGGGRALEGTWMQRIIEPRYRALRDATHPSQGSETAIRQKLLRAGFPYGLTARDYLLLKKVLTIAFALIAISGNGLVSRFLYSLGVTGFLLSAVLGAALGYIAPDFWLMMAVRKRKTTMQKTLPDVIDLISVSVEAGLSIMAAMQEVAQRFRGPMGDELLRAISEMRVGKSFAQALRDMAARLGLEDFTQFVSQIIQAETLGISVGNALKAQSRQLREKRRQRAEEQAQKAPVKMMVPLILFILPTLFIVIMGPAAIMGYRELSNAGFM